MAKQRAIRSTTVLCVRRDGKVVMASDGQVTLGEGVIKHSAKKIRRLYNDKVLAGFAGSTADAFNLFARFESKLEQYHGNLSRAAVELGKDWRTDKILRHLEALLVVADTTQTFIVSGGGDVIDPDEGIAAIGSGGPYATAAARALIKNTELPARKIAEEAMNIAGDICIYSNKNITYEELWAVAGYSGTPLVKKIGIKPGDRVLISGVPKGFDKELAPLPAEVKLANGAAKELNVALFFTDKRAQLEKELPKLKSRIAQNGMIWIAWPKKASKVPTDLTEDVIRNTALALGLVDIKVCAVNDVWSGLKLVIPVKDRK